MIDTAVLLLLGGHTMTYDFETITDHRGKDVLAVDAIAARGVRLWSFERTVRRG